MALTKSAQSGRSFLDGFLAKLPEALRADGQALIAKIAAAPEAEIEPALQLVGDGVLARPDYSKAMNDLKTQTDALEEDRQQLEQERDRLNTWWTANEGALKEYKVIKPEYDRLKGTKPADPPASPTNPPPGTVTEEVLEQRDRSFAGALALSMTLAQRHFQMFGEVLDMSELMADPRLGQAFKNQPGRVFGLKDAYDAKHGERVAVKAKEAEDTRINKIVEERLAEERKKLPVGQPFPVRGVEPSPLDVLQTKDGTAQHTLDSAVAEYDRLQAARAAG